MLRKIGHDRSRALDIAAALLRDLHEGKIERIGGDTIDAACDASGIVQYATPSAREAFAYLTTRMLVELVCNEERQRKAMS